jgi:hydrogenase maturation protein HypF
MTLLAPDGSVMAAAGAAVEAARERLGAGEIIAVKGLGGFHLACDAASDEAVSRLRSRKSRPARPLAVMCRDLTIVRRMCKLSRTEEHELCGPRRPILLLQRRREIRPGSRPISRLVAPGYRDLGVMLPYTPLHDLLLASGGPACVVMTSANRSGEPII